MSFNLVSLSLQYSTSWAYVHVYRWTLDNSEELVIWGISHILVSKNREKKSPMDRKWH